MHSCSLSNTSWPLTCYSLLPSFFPSLSPFLCPLQQLFSVLSLSIDSFLRFLLVISTPSPRDIPNHPHPLSTLRTTSFSSHPNQLHISTISLPFLRRFRLRLQLQLFRIDSAVFSLEIFSLSSQFFFVRFSQLWT